MTEIATEAPTVVAPKKVARVTPPIGTDHGLAGNRYHVTTGAAGKLTEHDLTVTTSARLGVWIGYTLVAGPPADHGEVADESAMLALHDWDTDPHDVVLYHYVLPGDSCTRADDPGYRWVCLRNHGQALTDWERRPLVKPIDELRSDVEELEIELETKIGSSALDGYIHTDDLDTSVGLDSDSSTVAPSTSAVREYVATAISGLGGGASLPEATAGQILVCEDPDVGFVAASLDNSATLSTNSALRAPTTAAVRSFVSQSIAALSFSYPSGAAGRLLLNGGGCVDFGFVTGISSGDGVMSAAVQFVAAVASASTYPTLLRLGSIVYILRFIRVSGILYPQFFVRLSDGCYYMVQGSSGVTDADGMVHTLVATCDGSSSGLRVYLDGSLVASGTPTDTGVAGYESSPTLYVGNSSARSEGFYGLILGARVWAGSVLSASDIASPWDSDESPTWALDLADWPRDAVSSAPGSVYALQSGCWLC